MSGSSSGGDVTSASKTDANSEDGKGSHTESVEDDDGKVNGNVDGEEDEADDGEETDDEVEGTWHEMDDGSTFFTMDGEDLADVWKAMEREYGSIDVANEQDEFDINIDILKTNMRKAMKELGCAAWDVGLVLTTDEHVQRLNSHYRGKDSSTDILSFPSEDLSASPGVLPKPRHPLEMYLGEMFVSLAYVNRRCQEDRKYYGSKDMTSEDEAQRGEDDPPSGGEEDDDDEEESEGEWEDERGVSGAMSRVFDVQERLSLLVVHGLIHLMGYDHESDEDYAAMVAVEERVLEALSKR